MYIPISNMPIKPPSYLSLTGTSPWHVGALQAVALESMTISSRLRSAIGGRGTLQDLEATFNSTGKRRVAKLELSVADPDVLSEKASAQIAQAEKTGSTTSHQTSDHDEQLTSFDIDTFTKDYRIGTSRPSKRNHIFGRAEAARGDWNLAEDRDPHDRFGDGPALQRYVAFKDPPSMSSPIRVITRGPEYAKRVSLPYALSGRDTTKFLRACYACCILSDFMKIADEESNRFAAPLLFPLLDSFPTSIFDIGTGEGRKVAVHSGLTASTAVADQVRAVERIVSRLHMIGIDERESICNGLQTMAEEYDEGWDSGSDSDEDD